MAIKFSCPHCGHRLRVRDESAAGKPARCKKCGRRVTVPHLPESGSTAEPPRGSSPQPAGAGNPLLTGQSGSGSPAAKSGASGSSRVRIPSGTVTIVLLVVVILTATGRMVVQFQRISSASDIRGAVAREITIERHVDVDFHTASDRWANWTALAFFGGIAAAGAMLLWTRRARRVLSEGGVSGLRYPELASYWWIVPLANLVMPFLVVREILLASRSMPDSPGAWQHRRAGPLFRGWWAAAVPVIFGWTIFGWIWWSGIVLVEPRTWKGSSGTTGSMGQEEMLRYLDALRLVGVVDIVFSLLSALAALLTILLIREVVARQRRSFQYPC